MQGKTRSARIDSGPADARSTPVPPMPYTTLTFDVADRIATITVNRPDKLNALNAATIGELGEAIDEAVARDDVGGVILTGAGRAFVAGADISEMAGQSTLEMQRLARRGQLVFRRFRVEGVSQRQIADELGISLSAVEKHLQKAYRALIEVRRRLDAE